MLWALEENTRDSPRPWGKSPNPSVAGVLRGHLGAAAQGVTKAEARKSGALPGDDSQIPLGENRAGICLGPLNPFGDKGPQARLNLSPHLFSSFYD